MKDGRGGETTETANVSAHGIAVFTPRPRPLRQYLELELHLPDNDVPINITAVVARHASKLLLDNGREGPGLGLDFFLFDARAKQSWGMFLQALRQRGVSAVAPLPPGPPRPPTPAFDDTPTFIIKPRDLGRLWAFYRGEMTKGRVRIETPILKPIGSTVELLVVHPSSQAEWILEGHIATTNENARGGRPVLEIELDHLDGELKSDFRNFVATGRGMIEEDISMSLDVPSKVSEISAPPGTALPPARPVDLDDEDVEMPPTVLEPSHIQSGPPPAAEEPPSEERFESVVIDLDNLGEEELRPEIVDPPPPLADEDESEDATLDGEEPAPQAEEDPTLTPRSPEVAADPVLKQAVAPDPDPDPAEEGSRVTNQHLFSAFFEEAAEAEQKRSSQIQVKVARESTRRLRPPSVSSSSSPSGIGPAIDDLTPPKTGLRLIPRSVVLKSRAMPPDLPSDRSAPSPPPMPSGDEPIAPLPESGSQMRVVRGAPVAEEEPEHPPRPPSEGGVAPRIQGVEEDAAQNPPVPPGTMFEYHSEEVEAEEPLREPALPPSARRRRRDAVERESTNVHHSSFSTEGSDPALDRDIALARARVVRSPNSVTACYRLSALLVQRGALDNLDDALETLRRVTELEPNHPGAHHKLAEVLARRGDYLLAAEHLNRARRLGYRTDPDLEAIVAQGVKQP